MASDITGNIPSSFIQALAAVYPPGLYPSHIDIFGKGGFVPLNDAVGASSEVEFINDRIIEQRRKVGMFVYLSDINEYYRCSSLTGENNWERLYFSGRYFHGATAPTADDIQQGEKWFDTIVGTEYTYLPIAEGSTHFSWVDIDSIGSVPDGSGISGINLYVDDTLVESDTTSLKITGGENVSVVYTNGKYVINSQDNADEYVKIIGDTMLGTLTGTDASFDSITASNGFVGTLTGNIADFGHITADTGFIGTLTGNIADFGHITADTGFIGTLTGNIADFGHITADTGFIGTLTGNIADFGHITADTGFIENLEGNTANFNNINEYYYGESLPQGVQFILGDKWFNPNIGTEFTYLQINNDPNNLAWVDIDHVYNDNQNVVEENLITNGNFLVWQRGKAFRALSDLRVRNQTKKQIGLLYYNTEHNTNLNLPSQHIGGRARIHTTSGYYNYGRMSFHAADRWNFGWQNYGTADSFSPLTGQGFYVYRGFINPEDAAIVENSSYFSRISTSPPPSNSPNRSNDIVNINNSGYEFLRNTVNPTSPNGLTYGAIVSHLLGDDRPNELKGASADPSRVTDVEYVTSYFDPYNVCIPITGNTDVAGQRAAFRDNSYWASIRHVIPQKYFKKMKFGTPQAEDLTLRFYARSNVVGDYYVCFQSGWSTAIGGVKPSAKVAYKKYTIDTANTWNLIEIGLSGDTSNVGSGTRPPESSEDFLGPWYNGYKNDANIGLSIWWLMGSGSVYLEAQGNDDNYNWRFISDGGKWGGSSQVNLLGATGNYFDIAEVSLVKSSHQGKIHFPRKESEILEECYQYYRHINVFNSESTQTGAGSLGTCPGTQVVLRDSTNEYGIELDHPIRMPQDNATIMASMMLSNTRTNNDYSIRLAETSYTRIYPKILTTQQNGTFPSAGPSGPESSGTGSDLNRLAVGWDHDIGPTLNDILLGMTGHTNSPFRDGTFYGIPNYYLKTYGWDSATDLSDYFKLAYGHRGWCSPTVYGKTQSFWYVSNGYSENPSFYIGWTRKNTSQLDSALFGSFSFDTEYLWNERD